MKCRLSMWCAQGALVALKPIYKQKIDISKPLLMEIKKVLTRAFAVLYTHFTALHCT